MNDKSKLRLVLLFVGVAFFMLASGFVIFVLFYLRSRKSGSVQSAIPLPKYQYVEFNPTAEEVNVGLFGSYPKHLKKGEYQYLRKEDGGAVLISNFGEKEYMCTGSCYCENDERRISQALLLSRGIGYLLVASSTVLAVQYASKYFENECKMKFEDDCPAALIESDIEKCFPVDSETDDANSKAEEKPVKYVCNGNCIPNEDFREDFLTNNLDEDVIKKIGLDGQISQFDCGKRNLRSFVDSRHMNLDLGETKELAMRMTWMGTVLDPYCRRNSMTKLDGFSDPLDFSMCVGYTVGKSLKFDPSNYCKKLPWWHRENIGSFNSFGSSSSDPSSPSGGGGGGGCKPPAGGCGGCGGCS